MTLLTYNDWRDQYEPTTEAPFEAHGGELKLVNDAAKEKPFHVWTLIHSGTDAIIRPGLHFLGRKGHYITQQPYNPRTNIEVTL